MFGFSFVILERIDVSICHERSGREYDVEVHSTIESQVLAGWGTCMFVAPENPNILVYRSWDLGLTLRLSSPATSQQTSALST